jgi:hypothetical protein
MINDLKTDECPIWKKPASVQRFRAMVYNVSSERADGTYEIDLLAAHQMPLDAQFRARLTTWIVDQRRGGEPNPLIDSAVLDRVSRQRPLRLSERTERFFLYLSAMRYRPGDFFYTSNEQGRPSQLGAISAWTEAESHDDALGLIDYILSAQLAEVIGQGRFRLTGAGFVRLEDAERASPDTTQAFIAMWFGKDMEIAYTTGFDPAVREAGFTPMRIDRKEHANKIDDEIIMEIRRSRFIVADFTCPLIEDKNGVSHADARGGVYYEAGFAQGLNIPVIWTVREDLISRVHFDTRQFAHITWSDPADLRAKLRNRIGAVITPP